MRPLPFLSPGSQQSFSGILKWQVTGSNSSFAMVTLSLSIRNIDTSSKIIVQDRMAYYPNGTRWGYFPFWIDHATVGDRLNISGIGEALSVGKIDQDNVLKNTPQGWQNTFSVTAVSSPKIFNVTLTPWYHFGQNSGLLLDMSGDDPIWTLLGNFLIAGTVTLQATSLDLGPQSIGFIFLYLYEALPVILPVGVFAVAAFLYRRKTMQRRRLRGETGAKHH